MVSAPLQRTAMNRQHARRAGQPFTQRIGTGPTAQSEMSFSARSPQGHPTPSSHASSPTAISMQSPASMQQGGGMTPPASVMHGQQQQQQPQAQSQQQQHYGVQQQARPRYVAQHAQRVAHPVHYGNSNGGSGQPAATHPESSSATSSAPSAYYPSPFQKHIEELGKLSHSPFPFSIP